MAIFNLVDAALGVRQFLVSVVAPNGAPGIQQPGQALTLIPSIFTLTATADPTVNNDITTGVVVGSEWFNATPGQLRWWVCRSNAQGAAAWVFDGADYANGGTNPAIEITAFGQSTAVMAEEGNINRQVLINGVSPTQLNQDVILAGYQLPALAFDIAGRGICITSQGSFANNANNKRLKIIVGCSNVTPGQVVSGGTAIADTGVIATQNAGWSLMANIYKAGATGSNTQLGLHQQSQVGAAVSSLTSPTTLTLVENQPINVVVTANCATNLTDAVQNFLEVNAMN